MTTVKHNAMTNHNGAMNPSNLASVAMLAARVLLASIFVLSGLSKIVSQGPTEAYMQALGIPGALLWPAILFGIVAGMLVIMGYQTRIAALLMAGFRLANNINPKHRPAADTAARSVQPAHVGCC